MAVPPLELADAISFIDSITIVGGQDVSDVITFIDTITVEGFKLVQEEIDLIDTLQLNVTLDKSFSDALVIRDSIIVLPPTDTNVSTCDEGYPVTLGTSTYVSLMFPYISPTTTLVLRNPKFGNTNTTNTNTRFQRTRSGQLNVVRGSHWPTIETFKVSFEALTQDQADAFRQFVIDSVGLEVGYLDQEARQWRGFIIDPTVTTAQVAIGCQYALAFEFRGRLA